jgi:DNA repair protein RecN (Recombination protein N)
VEFNPKRLAWVEARLSLLRQLERKYGGSIADVIVYGKEVAAELETLEHSDERISELSAQEADLLETCAKLCQELSEKRQAASANLCKGVEVELNDLRMSGTRLGVAFRWRQTGTATP